MNAAEQKVAEFIELSSGEDLLPDVFALTERHYEQGRSVCIYVPDKGAAEGLDAFLWTCRQNSFIPHVRLEHAEEPVLEPVLIAGADPGEAAAPVLIVVSAADPPDWFERCEQLYDFAPTYDEQARLTARRRYAAYKEAGYRMRFRRAGQR